MGWPGCHITCHPPQRHLEMAPHAARPYATALYWEQATQFETMDPVSRMVEDIRPDLHHLGWKKAYGRHLRPQHRCRPHGKTK